MRKLKKNINQLKAGVILTYISMGFSTLASIVYTPIMLRMLGQSEYGLYNLAASTISYLYLFNLGFSSSYMRFYARYNSKNDEKGLWRLNGMYLTVFIILGCLAAIVGGILIFNIDYIFSSGLTTQELKLIKILMTFMIFNLVLSFSASVFDANIVANEKFIFQKSLQLIKNILNPVLILILLFMGYKSISLVITATILTVMSLIINIIYCFKRLNIKFLFDNFDWKLFKEIGNFSFYIFLIMIVDNINWNVDKFILGIFRGTTEVAIYSVGSQLNKYYLTFSVAISTVFIPRVNNIVAESDDNTVLTELFIKVGRIQFLVLSLILSGFIFYGQTFIKFWAGIGYEDSYYIALLLLSSVTLPLIQNLGGEIRKAKNLHRIPAVAAIFMAIVNLIISIPLAKYFGGIGCAVGTAISFILFNGLFMNYYYKKFVGLNIIKFFKSILKIVPALILPAIYGIITTLLITINGWLMLGLSIIMYTIIFVIAVWMFAMSEEEKNLVIKPMKRFIKNCS